MESTSCKKTGVDFFKNNGVINEAVIEALLKMPIFSLADILLACSVNPSNGFDILKCLAA